MLFFLSFEALAVGMEHVLELITLVVWLEKCGSSVVSGVELELVKER